jgi:hypothetical protein
MSVPRRSVWSGGLAAGLLTLVARNSRASILADAAATLVKPRDSGYAPINGLRMYYEIHGTGGDTPLLLLHGGGSTINSTFGRALPFLASLNWFAV